MDFNWLQTFVVAAEHSNFRKTAELLFLSQPTVTVHIKLLEKTVGAKLFERVGRKVILTEEGRRFLIHAKDLLKGYEAGLRDIQTIQQGFQSSFIIGISPSIADTILPFVLKQFIKKHPTIEITVKIIESTFIEEALFEETVDFGLSCLDAIASPIISYPVSSDTLVLVVPHDGYDLERGSPMDEELIFKEYSFLTHNHPGYWDDLCQQIKIKYPNTKMMKVSQTHITKRFIIEGLGASILPRSTVRRELLEGSLLEVNVHSISLPEIGTYALMKYEHSIQKEFLTFISKYHF
ncbi:LysR family transcriptional regulator [Bacillus sp. THAF10]|uniref:LysR family transcriptional regulator n=1 Tax=Bacillus sp. THAF10 TaxID=2587848 RepID=UPI0012694FF7|nr:LysR family transcriptional regulator [Bacillus sp. THAF10]